jgi:hypothetical protein
MEQTVIYFEILCSFYQYARQPRANVAVEILGSISKAVRAHLSQFKSSTLPVNA